jgi:hypothetical protein
MMLYNTRCYVSSLGVLYVVISYKTCVCVYKYVDIRVCVRAINIIYCLSIAIYFTKKKQRKVIIASLLSVHMCV